MPAATVEAMSVASVLGSDFDLSLLAACLDTAVDTVLERIEAAIDARLIVFGERGRCRFSHALVRDTLYEELGVTARAVQHQRTAEALERVHGGWRSASARAGRALVPRRAAGRPWSRHRAPGQRRSGRNVTSPTARPGSCRTAFALIDAMPDNQRKWNLELEVQHELSMLLGMTVGYASPAVEVTCRRMRTLCDAMHDHRILVPALWRQAVFACVRRLDTSSSPRRYVREPADATVAGFVPEFPAAWVHVCSAMNLALVGEEAQVEEQAATSIELAAAAADRTTIDAVACATWFASVVATILDDVESTRRRCEDGISIATARGPGMVFVPFVRAHLGWAVAREGEVDVGLAQIESSAISIRGTGASMWRHVFAALSADACLVDGRFAEAIAIGDAQGTLLLRRRAETTRSM